jgi:hypothetical protein
MVAQGPLEAFVMVRIHVGQPAFPGKFSLFSLFPPVQFHCRFKDDWKSRVYLELFSGPARCLIRRTGKEDLGSPLKVIEHEFTKFIFIERSLPMAQALAQRLEQRARSDAPCQSLPRWRRVQIIGMDIGHQNDLPMGVTALAQLLPLTRFAQRQHLFDNDFHLAAHH